MILVKLLFDDGSVCITEPHNDRDFDDIEWFIEKHPEVIHVDLIIQAEGENNDND